MQLVAYGAQDIYLTGQPQITFFKSVYRRHTNFATESIQQTINGNPAPGARVSVTVSRNGDLLKNLWIQYSPQNFLTQAATTLGSDFGHALLNQLELEIGGQLIDRQYGVWLTIWRDLTEQNSTGQQGELTGAATCVEPDNADPAVAPSTKYQRMSYTHNGLAAVTAMTGAPSEAYIPMRFWFCRNPGLAVPLIALQYHEVKFNITFAATSAFTAATLLTQAGYASIAVYADYVYLDTTERRQFAQNAHEYLIDQLQTQSDAAAQTIRLNFNHPVKELIFIGAPAVATTISTGSATPAQFVATPATTGTTLKVVLNGTDRFTARNIKYFTRNQIWDCHTGFGSTAGAAGAAAFDSIGVYSFALRPEEHQPSGTCNFSRIDTAQLVFSASPSTTLQTFAVNYNVLRIMSGMGGLAYSN